MPLTLIGAEKTRVCVKPLILQWGKIFKNTVSQKMRWDDLKDAERDWI